MMLWVCRLILKGKWHVNDGENEFLRKLRSVRWDLASATAMEVTSCKRIEKQQISRRGLHYRQQAMAT